MTIWHPLIDPNQRGATTDSNLDDMEVIRGLSGESRREAIQAMILANMPLVILKVESYLLLFPGASFLEDDLISEGILALIEAINRLSNLETLNDGDDNPTGYINQRIIWKIGRFVENDEKQRVPNDYSLSPVLDIDPTAIVETRDLLIRACQTEEDMIIMEMRGRGCVDQEVADRLSIPRSAVRVQRHELMQRYDSLVQETL